MNRNYLKIILAILVLGVPCLSWAQSVKTITLRDGSVIKGKVTQLRDGIYTITTDNLGKIDVAESEVLGIGVGTQSAATPQETSGAGSIKDQVQALQGTLMSDPQVMMEIEALMDDPEIRAALSDPEFMSTIMSYDPNKIQQDKKTQSILQNSKLRSLVEKISRKLPDTGN